MPAKLYYGNLLNSDPYIKKRLEVYLKLLTPYLKKGVKILDIGGYTADFLCHSRESENPQIEYFVADFDKPALKIARDRGAKTQYVNLDRDYQKIYPKEKFDIIMLCEVLEHLVDPESVLTHAKKLLKPEGKILISLPNENTLYHRIMSVLGFGVDSFAFKLYKHLHMPTIAQSRNFVGKQLKIVKEAYWYHVGFTATRTQWLSKITKIIPDSGWQWLSNKFPNLFARGVVFLCHKSKSFP